MCSTILQRYHFLTSEYAAVCIDDWSECSQIGSKPNCYFPDVSLQCLHRILGSLSDGLFVTMNLSKCSFIYFRKVSFCSSVELKCQSAAHFGVDRMVIIPFTALWSERDMGMKMQSIQEKDWCRKEKQVYSLTGCAVCQASTTEQSVAHFLNALDARRCSLGSVISVLSK